MTREDIIRMAREAGPLISTPFDVWCERFAALVAAAALAEDAMQRLTDVQQEMEQKPAIYPEEARELGPEEIPYYTHPPRREWVGLTDDEIDKVDCIGLKYIGDGEYVVDCESVDKFARAIEAKLKEKNS
jgi:hypothetical protein